MTWAKIDDKMPRHPKVLAMTDSQYRAWMTSIAYCAEHLTDGFVPDAMLRMIVSPEDREALQARASWDACEGGILVHDFLDYNLSRLEYEANSHAKAKAGRKGGLASAAAKAQAAAQADAKALAEANAQASVPPNSKQNSSINPTRPDPNQTTTQPEPLVESGGSSNRSERKSDQALQTYVESETDSTSVGEVFAAWQVSTGRPRTRLDDKRRRLIRQALKSYPTEDLVDAVRGWKRSPHHRGENDRHTIYNDLSLLLRDAEHIERFRDLERGQAIRNPVRSSEPAVVALREARARLEAAAQ